jgi:hypothetical protein
MLQRCTIFWNCSLDNIGHYYQALTLVEFLIKNGSERFIEAARDKLFKIKRLQDYNFFEGTVDKGSGCREKAKQIVELLGSNESIRSEREKARALRSKFGGVGSDSKGFGGGGGSGYGGSSYSGSSDRYGDSGLDSRDRAGAGGRYGGDSYSSDRAHNDRSHADRGGRDNDRYNDRDQSGDTRNTGRYGGGAYDSSRPPRFSDDGPTDGFGNDSSAGRRGSYNRDEDDVKPSKSTPFAPRDTDRGNTATGGKLKVSIKKAAGAGASAPAPAPAAPQPEVNLMGDDFGDFGGAPAPAAAAFDPFGAAPSAPAPSAAASAFDPFGAAPAAAPAASASFLDAFTAPATAAPPAPAFDPFNQPASHFPAAAPMQPQQQQFGQFQQPSFQQQMPPQQQQFQQAPMQQQYGQFQGFPPAAPAPAPSMPQQQPVYRTAPPADADFGDFEAAKPTASSKQPSSSKWGDLGSLVDLGGIAKNAPAASAKNEGAAASNPAYAQNSFAGLDGFNKTQQSMVSSHPAINVTASCVNTLLCACVFTGRRRRHGRGEADGRLWCARWRSDDGSQARWSADDDGRPDGRGTPYGRAYGSTYGLRSARAPSQHGLRRAPAPRAPSHGRHDGRRASCRGHGVPSPHGSSGLRSCTYGRDDASPAARWHGWFSSAAAVQTRWSRYVTFFVVSSSSSWFLTAYPFRTCRWVVMVRCPATLLLRTVRRRYSVGG